MFGLKIFKYILKFLTIAFCVAFVVLNMQDTTFYYSPLATPLELPLWALGLLLFGIGFIMGALLVWLNDLPKKSEIRRLKKENVKLEEERDSLESDIRNHDRTTKIESVDTDDQ
jgi:uncharacterized membrane protein YciS (DUF1049 family)